METVYEYLTPVEAQAQRAYLDAYRAAYARVYEPGHSQDRERLLYWSALAHGAGRAARERVLSAHEATSL